MRIKICVPSKSRAELFYRKTYQILQHVTIPWCVYIDPSEYKVYKNTGIHKKHIVTAPLDNLGFDAALAGMRQHCIDHRYEFCWKMDDDIHHAYTQSKVIPKHEQARGLERVIEEVFYPCVTHLGEIFGGISFANKFFHQDWRRLTHVNKMLEGVYIIKAQNWFTPIGSKGFNEEPIAAAKLLLDQLITVRTGIVAWSHDMSTEQGGLQLHDRVTGQKERYTWMQHNYPQVMELLTPKEYKQKTGITFTVVDKKVFNKRHSIRLPIQQDVKLPLRIRLKLEKLLQNHG